MRPDSRSSAWLPSSHRAHRCRPSPTGWRAPSRPATEPCADLQGAAVAGLDLLEYQGKEFLAAFGVPVPPGAVAQTLDEAVAAAGGVGFPLAVKAQVRIGGRGKAG